MEAAKSCMDAARSRRNASPELVCCFFEGGPVRASCGGEYALSASALVDAAFEVRQCCEHVVEGGGLREIHVPHRLVITPQRRQTLGRWDEAKGPRLREVVT